MTAQAILPRSDADPTSVDPLERQAMADFRRRLKKIDKEYKRVLALIPAQPVVNARYTFDLSASIIEPLFAAMSTFVDNALLEGGASRNWFYRLYVSVAAAKGVAQEFANLSVQAPAYKAARGSVGNIVSSEPYIRRAALARARIYEGMKGLSENVKADMSRVIADGVGRGKNPLEIARNITAQTDIEIGRANRIARTEVTTALRRARWDEAQEARENYGIKSRLLHMSALSTTTRATHAARHGNLYSDEEVRDWYSEGANAINCKCNQISVVVDDDGKPLNSNILRRARERKELMKARGEGPWIKEDGNE